MTSLVPPSGLSVKDRQLSVSKLMYLDTFKQISMINDEFSSSKRARCWEIDWVRMYQNCMEVCVILVFKWNKMNGLVPNRLSVKDKQLSVSTLMYLDTLEQMSMINDEFSSSKRALCWEIDWVRMYKNALKYVLHLNETMNDVFSSFKQNCKGKKCHY